VILPLGATKLFEYKDLRCKSRTISGIVRGRFFARAVEGRKARRRPSVYNPRAQ
jgi:hypothetical protein